MLLFANDGGGVVVFPGDALVSSMMGGRPSRNPPTPCCTPPALSSACPNSYLAAFYSCNSHGLVCPTLFPFVSLSSPILHPRFCHWQLAPQKGVVDWLWGWGRYMCGTVFFSAKVYTPHLVIAIILMSLTGLFVVWWSMYVYPKHLDKSMTVSSECCVPSSQLPTLVNTFPLFVGGGQDPVGPPSQEPLPPLPPPQQRLLWAATNV